MTRTFKLPTLKCLRCGHDWIPRRPQEPKKCPRCASPYWNKPKWKGLKTSGDESRKHDVANQPSINDKSTYNYLKSSWRTWVTSAKGLVEIASKLESDRFPHDKRCVDHPKCDIYYMLVGFALENYLKAAIVQRSIMTRTFLQPDRLDEFLNNHDIGELFSRAGLTVESRRYRPDFDYLTECIRWRGRYPVPVTAKEIGGSLGYSISRQGNKLYHSIFGTMHLIPIDTIHQFLDIASRNLEDILQKAKTQTA